MSNTSQLSVVDFYSQIAEKYVDVEDNWIDWLSFNKSCLKELIELYFPDAVSALDCAAGVGSQALALEALGLKVVASDICSSALDEIRKVSSMPTILCGWHELRKTLPNQEFDVIFCMDNAIGHTANRTTLEQAIAQMSSLLSVSADASLFISTRDFDKMKFPRPSGFPENRIGSSSYHQKWTWISSDEYFSTWYINGEEQATTKMRCIYRSEIKDIAVSVGLNFEECKPIYTQPVYRLYRD